MPAVDLREILAVARYNLQQLIRGARHQVTFQHIGNTRARLLKGVQHLLIIFRELGFDRTDCFLRYSKSLCSQVFNAGSQHMPRDNTTQLNLCRNRHFTIDEICY